MLRDDRDRVVAEKRRPAGEHLVQRSAQRVEIAALVGRAPDRLFGRKVCNRADDHALRGDARPVGLDRQPEIAEPRRTVGRHPDVGRLEVAVNDPAFVRVLERERDLLADSQRVGDREPMIVGPLDRIGDRSARHQLRDDVGLAVLVADVEHRDDVGMIAEARHRTCLAIDPPATRVVEAIRLDDRDRDVTTEPRVARRVHDLARAFAEQSLHPIAAFTHGDRQRAPGSGSAGGTPRARSRTPRRTELLHGFRARNSDKRPFQIVQMPASGRRGERTIRPGVDGAERWSEQGSRASCRWAVVRSI